MKIREVKLPHPSFVEEFILNDEGMCHMKGLGWRRYRIEYGFECGCPEGILYLPPEADADLVEELLIKLCNSIVKERTIDS